jgi:hypothetical protein
MSFFKQLVRGLGSSLWDQCQLELQRVNGDNVPIEEVDRLAKIVSHNVYGDWTEEIQKTVSEFANGFEDLPF